MSKTQISEELEEYATLLQIDGQTGRSHAYDKAARAVRRSTHIPANPARLTGVGDSTREAIIDLENGVKITELDELREKYDWYTELKDVKHLGPSRAEELHETLNVSTLEELHMVARNGDLQIISGVGPKTAEKIQQSIEEQI